MDVFETSNFRDETKMFRDPLLSLHLVQFQEKLLSQNKLRIKDQNSIEQFLAEYSVEERHIKAMSSIWENKGLLH